MKKLTLLVSLVLSTLGAGAQTLWNTPQFGGTRWTWNGSTFTSTSATGETTTSDAPGRADGKGPVYVFNDCGIVSKNISTDTSDSGGIIVTGNSNVTSKLGGWAGAVQVGEGASATVFWTVEMKGTEPVTSATVWTDGNLTIKQSANAENHVFDMSDGQNQRWYIGEHGRINTAFSTVTKDNRTWDIQIVVADRPAKEGVERTTMTLTKKVISWCSDISADIHGVTAYYKDAEGNLTQLDNSAIKYDNTGLYVSYQGLGYSEYDEELLPSIPEGSLMSVATNKANFLIPATSATDNDHWYILTQSRGTNSEAEMRQSVVYDNGSYQLKRADVGTSIDDQMVAGHEKYLVRFFEEATGKYKIQFATGNFVTPELTTANIESQRGFFSIYNIADTDTHIGWNKWENANIVDNNGAGNIVLYYASGAVTSTGGNNDWSLYEVELIGAVTVNYTLHCEALNTDFTGSYQASWAGDNTHLPVLNGVDSYTISNPVFTKNGSNYTLAADITVTFPFPVSTATNKVATGIQSAIGEGSKWFVNDNNIPQAFNASHTNLNYSNQESFKWYIYPDPALADGDFCYKIQSSNGKYFPSLTAHQGGSDQNPLVDEAEAGSYRYLLCNHGQKGFTVDGEVFLSINSGSQSVAQNVFAWFKDTNTAHNGSDLSFPVINITAESVISQFTTLKNAEKLDILDGSVVVGPSEFANPVEINAAIDEAAAIDEDDVAAMSDFNSSANGAKIQTYLAKLEQYHNLYTYHLTVTKAYATMILPCPSAIPEGMTVSTVNAHSNGTLTLANAGNIAANTPYIVEATVGDKYTIIGWLKNHQDTHTGGWLTGVLAEDGVSELPENAYVLAENADHTRQAFVKATSADAARSRAAVTVNKHECYLVPTLADGEEAPESFIFENAGTTSIFEVENVAPATDAIYDLQGRRLAAPAKGINIIGGRKVLVK